MVAMWKVEWHKQSVALDCLSCPRCWEEGIVNVGCLTVVAMMYGRGRRKWEWWLAVGGWQLAASWWS